ncbi:PIG-L family deacetylase [Caldanaerobacter subterraneus]|uniref:PIG-L family deacetylase n=1 Tax=Caldanaerobacter subterraneus TaxID=911092 RepID=UPI0032BF5CEA
MFHLCIQRVLIIAPHPNDETLAAVGLIQDTLKYGGEVKVVVMTNRDSFKRAVIENCNTIKPTPHDFLRLGYERHAEKRPNTSVFVHCSSH